MQKLHGLKTTFLQHPRIITSLLFGIACASLVGLWAVSKYYFPPKYRLAADELAKAVMIQTEKGSLIIELSGPHQFAIAQFTRFLRAGFYAQNHVHRIVPDLLIQTGDPLSRYPEMQAHWGEGGSGSTFALETSRSDEFNKGTVALADTGTGSYGSQFFIVLKDTSWLKGKATIIGHVTAGMDTLDAIAQTPIDAQHRPQQPITLLQVIEK